VRLIDFYSHNLFRDPVVLEAEAQDISVPISRANSLRASGVAAKPTIRLSTKMLGMRSE